MGFQISAGRCVSPCRQWGLAAMQTGITSRVDFRIRPAAAIPDVCFGRFQATTRRKMLVAGSDRLAPLSRTLSKKI